MGHPKLADVLDRTETSAAAGRLPMVVFDLDSSLFATSGRNLVILQEFVASVGRPDLAVDLTIDELGWDPAAPLAKRGASTEIVDALKAFWFERFFTDKYVVHDIPNPGAVRFSQAVHERGGFCYYLTGRHIHGMAQGTVASLTEHGFPFWRGRTLLHLKPDFHLDDAIYKQAALDDIASQHGDVVATFDNEPKNCNLFQARFPDALNFWVDTEHSPNPDPLHEALLPTKDFIIG